MNNNILTYKKTLNKALLNNLPGASAQNKMYPPTRLISPIEHNNPPKKCSVMIVLSPYKDFFKTLVIRRSEYDGIHSKQISFPGGKYEDIDGELLNTAIRETYEEISLKIDKNDVVGKLTDIYIPPSNFLVTPYVSIINTIPSLKKDPIEVSDIIEIDLSIIMNDDAIKSHTISNSKYGKISVPCFVQDGNIIWGATAMVLSELREILLKVE